MPRYVVKSENEVLFDGTNYRAAKYHFGYAKQEKLPSVRMFENGVLIEGRENPTTDAEHLRNSWIVVGGAAVLGLVGYLIWRSQQTTTTIASTYQGTQLGPGGSNVPLPSNQPTGPQGS